MTWTKYKTPRPMNHLVDRRHTYTLGTIRLQTYIDNEDAALVSVEGGMYNSIRLDRSEVNYLIRVLATWRDEEITNEQI